MEINEKNQTKTNSDILAEDSVEQIIRAAVDEVEGSVSYTLSQNHACGVGNYWIDMRYNIFCETCQDAHDESMYYLLKLERYEDEECVDTEVCTTDTQTLDKEELEKALRRLINLALQSGVIFEPVKNSPSPWILTDPDCLQCLRVISSPARIYELVQVNDYTDIEQGCRVARGTICLDQYSRLEIDEFLHFFGYKSLTDFEERNCGLFWSLVAEMAFETHVADYESSGPVASYSNYAEAGREVEKITGLDLKACYEEEH